jgi:hypothetical protein
MKYRKVTTVDKTDDNSWTGRKHLYSVGKIVWRVYCFENALSSGCVVAAW